MAINYERDTDTLEIEQVLKFFVNSSVMNGVLSNEINDIYFDKETIFINFIKSLNSVIGQNALDYHKVFLAALKIVFQSTMLYNLKEIDGIIKSWNDIYSLLVICSEAKAWIEIAKINDIKLLRDQISEIGIKANLIRKQISEVVT